MIEFELGKSANAKALKEIDQSQSRESKELMVKLDRDINDTLRTFELEKGKQMQEMQNLRREIQYMKDRRLSSKKGSPEASGAKPIQTEGPLYKSLFGSGIFKASHHNRI